MIRNYNDKMGLTDELMLDNGELILPMGKKATKIVGALDVINGVTGNKLFTFNDIIIPGASYIIEKFFNRRSTFGMTTTSQDLGVKGSITLTQDNLKNEFVFGFVTGIGGTEVPDLIKAVKFKDKTVSTITPLRVVPTDDDLSVSDQAKYAIKKTVGDNYHYYAKKFDTDIAIRHLFTDGTEIPPNINETDTALGMLVFGECVFTVSEADLREYFTLTYGSIDTCRFNSVGLVAGFLDGSDYAGVRVVTKVNMPNMFLTDGESFYKFVYKVYAI